MPSIASKKGYVSDELRAVLRKATTEDFKARQRTVSNPDAELLRVLHDTCVTHFDGDEEQARCVLRRYLVLRYQWTDETITRQLSEVAILRSASVVPA